MSMALQDMSHIPIPSEIDKRVLGCLQEKRKALLDRFYNNFDVQV